MENKVITFKLQGNNINLNDMKPEDAISVINDFVRAIKKIDKNFKLNNIKSGSLAISLDMDEFIENSNRKSENWIQKIKDILNTKFFPNEKYGIDKIDIEENDVLLYSIENNYIYDDVVYNYSGYFIGNITDIGGKIPNINIHIVINNQSIKFPIKDKATAKNWSSHLYEDVKIYAKVKKNINGIIIEGTEIFKLEAIESNDDNKVYKEFQELIKEIDFSNLTERILDMRHKDE
ncbi:hypothetical protein [Brachyspira pilosicoli]|uniref:hypothetical protein n=1 Tax=Brachyspira pilosicoli TaxID=52584 RepID=UPI000E155420|nr:hypothetical protein [Brachyspira pilosicoli]SUW04490.1 Uncharacterised protein [Brachyspira pilosicoli]